MVPLSPCSHLQTCDRKAGQYLQNKQTTLSQSAFYKRIISFLAQWVFIELYQFQQWHRALKDNVLWSWGWQHLQFSFIGILLYFDRWQSQCFHAWFIAENTARQQHHHLLFWIIHRIQKISKFTSQSHQIYFLGELSNVKTQLHRVRLPRKLLLQTKIATCFWKPV